MKKCGYADKYKGIRPPKCSGGKVCEHCRKVWEESTCKDCGGFLGSIMEDAIDHCDCFHYAY